MTRRRRRAVRSDPRRQAWTSAWLAIPALTPLMLDGVTAQTRAAVVFATALALLAILAGSRSLAVPGAIGGCVLLLLLPLVIAGLQLVPLPCGLVDSVGGDGRATLQRGVAALAGPAANVRCTISMDPGSTWASVGVHAAMLAACLAAARVTTERRSARSVLVAITAGATLLCLVTWAHELVGASRVYGLYEPAFARQGLVGPVLNTNHLAIVANTGLLCALFVVLDSRSPVVRVLAASAAVIDLATSVASHSRGGVLGIGIAILAVGYVVATRRRALEPRDRLLVAGTGVGLLATLAVVAALEGPAMLGEFLHAPVKTDLIGSALGLVPRVGALGAGSGAFAVAFAPISGRAQRAMHAENVLAHWGVELGAPAAALLLLGWVYVLARSTWGDHADRRIAGAAALAMLAHDLGDFALEMPGIAVLFGMLVGAACARIESGTPSVGRWDAAPIALSVAAAFVGGTLSVPQDLQEILTAAHGARDQRRYEREATILVRGLGPHPLEPTLAVELAANAVNRHDPLAIRWANLALSRAPAWLAPHQILARHFFDRGLDAQGLAELATIVQDSPFEAARTFCAVRRRPIAAQRLARLLPHGDSLAPFVREIGRCLGAANALRVVDAAAIDRPDDPRLAEVALELSAGLVGPRDAEIRFASASPRVAHDADFLLAGARIALAREDGPVARERVTAARGAGAEGFNVDATEAVASALARDEATTRRILAHLAHRVESGDLDVAEHELLVARCMEALGHADEALAAMERAYGAHRDPALLRRIAIGADRAGREARAREVRARLCDDFPHEPECSRSDARSPTAP